LAIFFFQLSNALLLRRERFTYSGLLQLLGSHTAVTSA